MKWDWLKKVAPTVATALAGPLAGVAVEAVASALGVETSAAETVLQSGKLDGTQIAAIRQAELALKAKEIELGVKFEQLANDDRASARNMQVAVRSQMPAVLSILVTLGFFGILAWMLYDDNVVNSEPILIMLGSLSTAWAAIIGYYFGSSASNAQTREILGRMTAERKT